MQVVRPLSGHVRHDHAVRSVLLLLVQKRATLTVAVLDVVTVVCGRADRRLFVQQELLCNNNNNIIIIIPVSILFLICFKFVLNCFYFVLN